MSVPSIDGPTSEVAEAAAAKMNRNLSTGSLVMPRAPGLQPISPIDSAGGWSFLRGGGGPESVSTSGLEWPTSSVGSVAQTAITSTGLDTSLRLPPKWTLAPGTEAGAPLLPHSVSFSSVTPPPPISQTAPLFSLQPPLSRRDSLFGSEERSFAPPPTHPSHHQRRSSEASSPPSIVTSPPPTPWGSLATLPPLPPSSAPRDEATAPSPHHPFSLALVTASKAVNATTDLGGVSCGGAVSSTTTLAKPYVRHHHPHQPSARDDELGAPQQQPVVSLALVTIPIISKTVNATADPATGGCGGGASASVSSSNSKIYVRHLPPGLAEQDLRLFFAQFGDIIAITQHRERSGTSFCAYITYAKASDAAFAILHGNGATRFQQPPYSIPNSPVPIPPLSVRMAETIEERNSRRVRQVTTSTNSPPSSPPMPGGGRTTATTTMLPFGTSAGYVAPSAPSPPAPVFDPTSMTYLYPSATAPYAIPPTPHQHHLQSGGLGMNHLPGGLMMAPGSSLSHPTSNANGAPPAPVYVIVVPQTGPAGGGGGSSARSPLPATANTHHYSGGVGDRSSPPPLPAGVGIPNYPFFASAGSPPATAAGTGIHHHQLLQTPFGLFQFSGSPST